MAIKIAGTTVIDDSRNATNLGTVSATTFGTASQNAYGARTVSTSDPSGGTNGDIWYKVAS